MYNQWLLHRNMIVDDVNIIREFIYIFMNVVDFQENDVKPLLYGTRQLSNHFLHSENKF